MTMRTFKHPTFIKDTVCPICKNNDDKEVVLIPIHGTKDGNNIQAIQTHTECIQNNWMYFPEHNIIIVNNKVP